LPWRWRTSTVSPGVFQFDDFNVIVNNPTVHSIAAWRDDLARGIRPLLKLSYTLNWITAAGAVEFHAVNLAIHVVNTMLVLWLARRVATAFGLALRDARCRAVVTALALRPAPRPDRSRHLPERPLGEPHGHVLPRGPVRLCRGSSAATAGCCTALARALRARDGREGGRDHLPLALACGRPADPARGIGFRSRGAGRALGPRDHRRGPVAGASALRHALGARARLGKRAQQRPQPVDAITYLVLRLVRIYPLNIDPDLRFATEWNLTLVVEAVLLGRPRPAAVLPASAGRGGCSRSRGS
jgi:hypothetical protein